MEYKEVVKNRFAARSFLPNQVRLSDLKDIILEAERTPSWMNAQERKIFLATGSTAKTIRREYMERAEKGVIGISDAPKWAVLDMGALEEAVILGAASRGIDSIVAYSIIKYPDIIRRHFPISENEDIVMGIALGYADKDAKINRFRSRRVPLSNILFTAE